MFLLKKENGIILSLIVFLTASFFYLAYTEQKQQDPNGYNIWELYFEDAKSGDLNFVIENHSQKTSFHWKASGDANKVLEGDIKITKGQDIKIELSKSDFDNKKTTIEVSDGKDKKEIYKNF